jgi:nucleotide-binding universal stress UspA family protein
VAVVSVDEHTFSPALPVLVGIDGSASSQEALAWAARQAELTHAPLRAVIAWRIPAMLGYAAFPADLDLEADARSILSGMVQELADDAPAAGIEQRVEEGPPVQVLLEQAKDASLLVVGSRGHGAFSGMLLGSVSEHCVSHAPCPVVVVRPLDSDDSDD